MSILDRIIYRLAFGWPREPKKTPAEIERQEYLLARLQDAFCTEIENEGDRAARAKRATSSMADLEIRS